MRVLIASLTAALTLLVPAVPPAAGQGRVLGADCGCGHHSSKVGDCRTHMCAPGGVHGAKYDAVCGRAPGPAGAGSSDVRIDTPPSHRDRRRRKQAERRRKMRERREHESLRRKAAEKNAFHREKRGLLEGLKGEAPAIKGGSGGLEMKLKGVAPEPAHDHGRPGRSCEGAIIEASKILRDYSTEARLEGRLFLLKDIGDVSVDPKALAGFGVEKYESILDKTRAAVARIKQFQKDFYLLADCLDKKCDLKGLEKRIHEEVLAWLKDQLANGYQEAITRVEAARDFLKSYAKRLQEADHKLMGRAATCLGS